MHSRTPDAGRKKPYGISSFGSSSRVEDLALG